ncbi:MAG: murein biosynthesis integral membrane protein MurJ [Verrucomicrobia bacterium]|nr:murein biosynthesis integral membrane protein MurJ [Verrucomicrobiota bacterium]
MSQMLKSSGAMGAATLLSRVLGMVREMVYAGFMGDGPIAGAFKFAFTIPNLFRRLLGEGALTAAFIPVFKEKERTAGADATWRAANAVLSGLAAVALAVTALVALGVSAALLTGAFADDKRLMLQLLRLMFPYMIFVCLTAVLVGMANARGHFFLPALGPALLNVVMISSVLFLAPRLGATLDQQIFGLAIGVLVAGAVQFAIQIPLLRREGFRFAWVTPWRDETVRRVARQMLPATIGVAAFQINVVLTQTLALWYGTESQPIVASFDYAVRLMELPQGVFGISLATYLLPMLAGLAAEKNYGEFRATLRQGLGYLCYANLLASVLLAVMAEPIVRLLFERGAFDALATGRAALALRCLAPGLVAFSIVNILARAFYALGDTHTPMRISLVCLAINLLLAWLFIFPLRQGGLALANTLTAVLNLWLLGFALRKKLKRLELSALRAPVLKMLAATVFAGAVAWFALDLWQKNLGHASLLLRLGEVFAPMTLAALLYWAATLALKVGQAHEIFSLLRRKSAGGKNGEPR